MGYLKNATGVKEDLTGKHQHGRCSAKWDKHSIANRDRAFSECLTIRPERRRTTFLPVQSAKEVADVESEQPLLMFAVNLEGTRPYLQSTRRQGSKAQRDRDIAEHQQHCNNLTKTHSTSKFGHKITWATSYTPAGRRSNSFVVKQSKSVIEQDRVR